MRASPASGVGVFTSERDEDDSAGLPQIAGGWEGATRESLHNNEDPEQPEINNKLKKKFQWLNPEFSA